MEKINEIWRDIEGYEGLYQISNLGRVKSFHDGKESIRVQMISRGYYRLILYDNNRYHNYAVHRLVAEAFIPNPENKPTVNHIDGNKKNNNVSNLEWATWAEQSQHMVRTGLCHRKGKNAHCVKLTDEQVLEIRKKYKFRKYTTVMLGKEYNVVPATIGAIIRKSNWKHLD